MLVKGLLALPDDALAGDSFFPDSALGDLFAGEFLIPGVAVLGESFLISLRSLGSKLGRSALAGALPLRRATGEGDLLGADPKRSLPPGEYLGAALPDIRVGDGDLLGDEDLLEDEDFGEDLGVSGDN